MFDRLAVVAEDSIGSRFSPSDEVRPEVGGVTLTR